MTKEQMNLAVFLATICAGIACLALGHEAIGSALLVIVLGFNSSQSGATTIKHEFKSVPGQMTSMQRCEEVRGKIIADALKNAAAQRLSGMAIVTHGCYPL